MTMKELTANDIAIIGINGRFPGAANVDEFWSNLVAGVESISTFSDEELAASGLDVAALSKDPGAVRSRGIVKDADRFDAGFFGLTAKQAEVTDPQQRVFLEAAWEALENSGYDPARVDGPIGVYAGSGEPTYYLNNLRSRADVMDLVGDRVIGLGNEKDYLAAWIAYKLNLRGPAISVNTACSTSLVAVCQACLSLTNYQCDMALAGGIWVTFPQKRCVYFQEGGIFSPDGHCRAFDAHAQGTVSSDGLGIVVLKRLEEALKDGDHVYAVIKGFGLNNDGSAKAGFTAPSVEGQAEAIATALAEAEFEPDTISYVECHGTATPIGDPIEISALTQAYRLGTDEKNFCALGALKSNIGHTGSAAGVAGLIKTALALKHKMLPPTLHFTRPNPKIDFADSPFFVNAMLRPWENVSLPRRAGVSSFGLGGTNAHVVLEEAPEPTPSGPSRPWQLLVMSAKSPAALDGATDKLVAFFKANPEVNLADAAFTLQEGRQVFEYRQIVACSDVNDAVRTLEARDAKRILKGHTDADSPSVVFMFTGQGAQYVNMGADIYRSEVIFKEQIDKCSKLLLPGLGLDLRDVLYPSPDKAKDVEELLTQTRITQPALFAFEYALATLWMSWGIKPAAFIGHSIGEYVAACLAGVFSLEDALSLVVQRGKLMQSMPHGIMLAVPMPEEELLKILPTTLSLATLNGPSQCVVSGPATEIEAFAAVLTELRHASTVLHTSHAFHSAMMDPILQPFADCVSRVKRGQPKIPFISNLTGTWITARDAADPQYWAKHLRNAVRFGDGIKELLKSGESILLEVGPGTTLTSLAKVQQQPGRMILSSSRHIRDQRSDVACLLTALGQLWLHGVQVDWAGFYAQENRHRIPLPTYAFQREKYWIERSHQEPAKQTVARAATRKNTEVADFFYVPSWKRSAPLPMHAPAGRQNWLVFLDECGLGAAIAERLYQFSQSITTVQPGSSFELALDGSFTIDPSRPEDYQSVIDELIRQNKLPNRIAHFWSVTQDFAGHQPEFESFPRQRRMGFDSLVFLAQSLLKRGASETIQISLVSNGVQEVNDGEKLSPGKTVMLGPCKVVSQEHQNLICRNIDVTLGEPNSAARKELVDQLFAELFANDAEPAVAYRGKHRWVQTFEHIRLQEPTAQETKLKANGVYLITGGLGKVGLLLAYFLAKNYRARLILLGRSRLPDKQDWDNWLEDHTLQNDVSVRIRKIQELESLGSEVMVIAADVADRRQMAAAIVAAKERFGSIDGVFHGAGVLGPQHYASISELGNANADAQFLAKVYGLLVLEDLFKDEKLDFVVLLSSLSSVLGGLSKAAYSAANHFMDAFALNRRGLGGTPWVSVNWDGWGDEKTAERSNAGATITEFDLAPAEGIEAFRRILGKSELTQVIISTGELSSRLDVWLRPQQVARATSAREADHTESGRHARPEVGIAFSAPTSESERVLAGIWQDLLGIQEVGVDDNFFDLGGDSLLLLRVQVKIRQAIGADLSAAEMFQHPTVGALARRLVQPAAEPGGLGAVQDRAQLQREAMARRQQTTRRN
jgi:acyl transferase domain-containing protein/aryl carrier-like protein